ncbi:hypothetical protein G7085_02750 [Tessaracoccus sp. HDW20]|uniref:ATP-binding protein n=1 Tax=Tessaracoccus coleopterorum TaxID=2714950 RepID=UPI0018D40A0E|nr:hypothetical protein [Tessaracoccus coleopterorum]
MEAAAYRIVAAALDNAARHASADHCLVRLAVTDGHLEIEVTDDGVGPAADFHAGIGITGMRERATELGGTCTVAAREGGGARVLARLPIGASS